MLTSVDIYDLTELGDDEGFATFNPARPGEEVGRYKATRGASVARFVARAQAAFASWSRQPFVERARLFDDALRQVENDLEPIAVAITREQGKPLAEARNEVRKAVSEARMMAGHVLHGAGSVMPSSARSGLNIVTRRPRGVIAAITPWNFPVLTPMRRIAPALLFGNSIVIKPSELAPASTCMLVKALTTKLPPDLISLALGGPSVGEALVGASGVTGITFTGSVDTGRKVYGVASTQLAEVSLEMGGKNAALVNDTENLDACLDAIVSAAFACSGQRCTAISRVIVSSSLSGEVAAGLVARSQKQIVGDGLDPSTTMGPLTGSRQFQRVSGMVSRAIRDGAKPLLDAEGAGPTSTGGGFFFQPTILSNVKPMMEIAQEEIFGPVIPILEYDTIDQAIEIANSVRFGLTTAVFSNRHDILQRLVAEIASGMIHVNHGTIPDDYMPFGGIRESGVGAYSVGASTVHFYTTEHAVYFGR
jgi:aldehyde dehydrogenase (NAD+)